MNFFDKLLNPFGDNNEKIGGDRHQNINREYKDLSKDSQKVTPITPSDLLLYCRNIAGNQIQTHMLILNNCKWIRAEYTYPAFDSMNFIYKSSVFSIIIDILDEEGVSYLPEDFIKRQLYAARTYNLIPCKFPVVVKNPQEPKAEEVHRLHEGWNLYHTETNEEIIPEQIASSEPAELSQWELHNLALNFIMKVLNAKNIRILSWQDTLEVDPQIWFLDKKGNKCWLLVRCSTEAEVKKPEKMNEIIRRCFKNNGYFGGIIIEPKNKDADKICRGGDVKITFQGFEKIHTAM